MSGTHKSWCRFIIDLYLLSGTSSSQSHFTTFMSTVTALSSFDEDFAWQAWKSSFKMGAWIAAWWSGRTACRSSVVFFKFLFWQCSTMPFLFPCSVQILQNIKSFSWLYLSHEYNLNHLGINLLVGGCFGVSSRGAGFVWSFELFSDSSELPRNTSIIERWSFDRQSFFFGGIADDYLTDYSNRNHAKKIEMLTCFVIVLNTIISRAGRHRSNVQQNAWRMRFC